MRKTLLSYGPQLLVLIGACIVFAVTTPLFRGIGTVYAVLLAFPLLGLVALGVSVAMLAGELDLSVGSLAAVAGIMGVRWVDQLGIGVDLLVLIAGGFLIGALQGLVIHLCRINSLVFTIGTLILFGGLAYVVSNQAPVTMHNLGASDVLFERWLGVLSLPIIIAAGVFAVVGLLLRFTTLGADIYAIGGGRTEAIAAGVSVRRPLMTAFGISGACACLAGGLASVTGGTASPGDYANLLLLAVSANVIGGISLYGGRGSLANVILGVALLSAISVGLTTRAAPSYQTDLVTGVLLVIVMALQFFSNRQRLTRASDIHEEVTPLGAQTN